MPAELALVESFLNSVDVESGTDELDSVPRYARWLEAHGQPCDDLTASDLADARALRAALRAAARAHHDGRPQTAHDGGSQTAHDAGSQAARDDLSQTAHDGRPQSAHDGRPEAAHDGRLPVVQHDRAGWPGRAAYGESAGSPEEAARLDGRGRPEEAAEAGLDALARRVRLRATFGPAGIGLAGAESGGRSVLGAVLAAVVLAERAGSWGRVKICREDSCQWAFYDPSKNSSKQWCSMRVCGNRNKTRAYRARQRR